MTYQEKITWEALQGFKIDDESSQFAFSDRLARENNWTKKFALGAIEEYKKFVFLAKHAGHPVTPSVEVDEVWHLHMIYTRSYWQEMCKMIGFDLHHGPTKGGKSENNKFNDWYTKTIESYKKYFGEQPPVQYWPSNEKRFAPNTIRKIDTRKFFMFKKPNFRKMAVTPLLVCASPLFIFLFLLQSDLICGIEPFFFWAMVTIGVVLIILWLLSRGGGNDGGGGGYSGGGSSGKKKHKSSDSGGGTSCGYAGGGCSSSHSDSGGGHGCGGHGCGASCGGGGCGGGGCGS